MVSIGNQNLVSRTPPCFGRYVKPFVPACICSRSQFQGGLTSGRQPIVKIIAESLSHDENMLYRPNGISVVYRIVRSNIYSSEVVACGFPFYNNSQS
jgi:hypothetical protein